MYVLLEYILKMEALIFESHTICRTSDLQILNIKLEPVWCVECTCEVVFSLPCSACSCATW